MQGRLITLEGPEGAGKSTLSKWLAQEMRSVGLDVVATRQPGDGPIGANVREALLHSASLDPWTELFLFLADRSQHCLNVIGPALDAGKWVICDRFADSTIVYQGYGRGLDLNLLRQLNASACHGIEASLTLLLDIDPTAGLQRVEKKDRLEQEPISFHARIRAGFLKEAEYDPERWRILDGSLGKAEVSDEAWFHVHKLIEISRS